MTHSVTQIGNLPVVTVGGHYLRQNTNYRLVTRAVSGRRAAVAARDRYRRAPINSATPPASLPSAAAPPGADRPARGGPHGAIPRGAAGITILWFAVERGERLGSHQDSVHSGGGEGGGELTMLWSSWKKLKRNGRLSRLAKQTKASWASVLSSRTAAMNDMPWM